MKIFLWAAIVCVVFAFALSMWNLTRPRLGPTDGLALGFLFLSVIFGGVWMVFS